MFKKFRKYRSLLEQWRAGYYQTRDKASCIIKSDTIVLRKYCLHVEYRTLEKFISTKIVKCYDTFFIFNI